MRARLGWFLAVLAIFVAGCGIENDGTPRDISPADGAPDVSTATSEARAQPGSAARIYLLAPESPGQPTRLQPVRRDIEDTPTSVFAELVGGLDVADENARLRTAIPNGVALLGDPSITGTTLVLNLNEAVFQTTGTALVDALAQIVFTMSALPSVTEVQLLVKGAPQEWPTGDGSQSDRPLTVFDYPEHNPTSQPEFPAAPPPASVSTTTQPKNTSATSS